jgi:hypothetical protein
VRWLVGLGLLACATGAIARDLPMVDVAPPLLLRLEGRFVADREQAAERADAVSLRIGDRDRWFAATSARTIGGDHPLSGRAVLNLLAPLEPHLIVVGDAELRERLQSAVEAGAGVVVEGLLNRGSRTYLLRDVTLAPPAR